MPSKYNLTEPGSPKKDAGIIANDQLEQNGATAMDNTGDVIPPENDDVEEEKKQRPMVGMAEVFRFSDCLDSFLIVLGIVASCCHGSAMPLMIIVFGGMTNTFIDNGKINDLWDEYGPNITATFNVTREDIQEHPEYLEKILCGNVTVDECPAYKQIEAALMDDFLDQMTSYTIYYIILGSAVLVISYVQLTCWTLSAHRQAQRIRTSLFQAILRQEIGWFDTHEIGELNTRLSDDVSKIQEGLGEKFGMFFQWMCSFLAGFAVGFAYGWELTLVILSISPLLAASGGVMAKMGAAFTTKELKAYAKAGAVAEETLGSIRTVTAFGGQEKECGRYDKNLEDARRFGVRKGIINGTAMGVVFLVMFASYALAFWFGTKLVREGSYSGGDVIIVFFSVLIGAMAIGNAAPNFQYFSTARGAAYELYHIIDSEPSIDSSSGEGSRLQEVTGNLEFRDVHFQYPSRKDVKVLQGLNVSVSVGQTVALVGSSGCGKSTTIQLLQRFYDPQQGQVLLDGVDIRQLNVSWLRQNIGVVSQEPVLFDTTIEDNIRYGKQGVSQKDIERAAREANAHDFIQALPKKYGTLVGEGGAQLSGGQKQRIAIARALIRDPKILLLDEATSALDTESEATVQEALDKARAGRTTLVIAHRLSTIKTADVIVGLDQGVVAEQGTHKELMEHGGIYYQLVTNQTMMDDEAKKNLDDEDGEIHSEDLVSENGAYNALMRTVSFDSSGSATFQRMTSVDSAPRRSISVWSKKDEDEDVEYPEAALGRIIKLNSPEWFFIILGCLGCLVQGAVQPTFAIIFSEIMGVFSMRDPEKQKSESEFYSSMFAVIGLAAGLSILTHSVMFSISGENLTMRLRKMTFRALMRQEMAYFDDPKNNTGALTTRLATETSTVQGATGSKLGSSLQAVCGIAVGLSIGFYYSWKLSLFICAFAPFILISGFIQMRVMLGSHQKDNKALEEAGKVAVEAIENIRTVAQLSKEDMFYNKYVEQTEVPYKKKTRRVHVSGISFGFSQGIVFYAYGFCFRFGAYLIRNDGLDYISMFKVISAIIFTAMGVGQATSFAPDYGKAKKAAAKIFALLDREPAIDSSDIGGTMPEVIDGNISFNDVKFNYPTRPDVRVLRGLSVGVSRGQTLALVGTSGCGKSTSISLLERFYDPLEGVVKIDDENIATMNIQWLRAQLGLVQQEPVLFDTSIRDNIAYGDNLRDVNMEEIIAAAKNANIHDFISSLPNGYDTNVGDKGAQLSGGQKQRVAIARALVRNPTILLLDEATSALDTESEKVVQEALDRARSGRTCIVIAHRLSTIQDADLIAVVHRGKVAELGKHQELMGLKGHYYKLNMAQAKKQ